GRPGAHAVRRRPRRRATALPVGRDHLDVSGGRTFDVRGVGGRDDRRPDGYLQTKVDDQDSDQVAVTEYRDVPVDANWFPRFGEWESAVRPRLTENRPRTVDPTRTLETWMCGSLTALCS